MLFESDDDFFDVNDCKFEENMFDVIGLITIVLVGVVAFSLLAFFGTLSWRIDWYYLPMGVFILVLLNLLPPIKNLIMRVGMVAFFGIYAIAYWLRGNN